MLGLSVLFLRDDVA